MQETNNQNQKNAPEVAGFKRAVPIILFALAAFIALCFITQSTGWLGTFISNVFLGLFSYGAYAIPFLLIIHGVFFFRDIENKCVLSRAIFSAITVVTISALSYTIYSYGKDIAFAIGDYYRLGVDGVGGGFVGSVISFALMKIFGSVGMIVIAVAIFALYISFFFAKSKRISGKFLYFLLAVLTSILAFFEKCIMLIVKKIKGARQRKRQEEIQIKNEEFFGDDFFAVDNGLKELKIEELGIKETRSTASIEANPTLHEKVFHKSAVEEPAEAVHYSDKVSEDSYIDARAGKKKSISFYENENTIIIEDSDITDTREQEATRSEKPASSASINRMYGLDENAEDVFTSDFDPFDFVAAESLASKPSSKAEMLKNERGISKAEESISNITEEDIKRARDIERFERSKRASIEHMRRTATPVASAPASCTTEFKNVEINVEKAEKVESNLQGKAYSVTIDKLEAQINRNPSAYSGKFDNDNLHYAHDHSAFPTDSGNDLISTDIEPEAVSEACKPQESIQDDRDQYEFSFDDVVVNDKSGDVAAENTLSVFDSDAAEYAFDNESNGALLESDSNDEAAEPAPCDKSDMESYSFTSEKDNDIFGANGSYDEPKADASHNDSQLFAPIDYSDDENDEALDESDLFKPFTEPSADDLRRTSELTNQADVLMTERSMLQPIMLDEEDEEENEEYYFSDNETEERDYEPAIIPENERNPEVERLREMFPFLNEDRDDTQQGHEAVYDIPQNEPLDEDDEPPFESDYTPITPQKSAHVQKPESPKKEEPKKPDYKNFPLPPIDLLVKDDAPEEMNDDEIQENANKLIETLGSFNVTVTIKGYDRGPRITRYEVVPAAGVKVTQVTNLENDVALALAAGSLRVEAPIPGKSAIGFEIPNKRSETVRLRDLIETEEFKQSDKATTVCIGKDVAGFPVISSIEKMPHVLIAGATGMGKSVCINSLMLSMLYKSKPDDIRFIMIDPKKVEFTLYEGIPHLLVPIVTDSKQAAGALMWAVEEMERRYELLGKLGVRQFDAYNEIVKEKPELGDKLARIVIVIDEFADLMLQVKDPVENLVMSLAQKARAAGIHLIIGTQRPSVNVLTGVIKANIPVRISCRVASNVDSRTILEQGGAEKLLDKGDMLFSTPGMLKPLRAQGAFVSDKEVQNIMNFLKEAIDGSVYDASVLEQINKAAQKCSKSNQSDSDRDDDDERSSGEGYLNDKKFLEAVELAVNTGSIATSKLQRKMSIGFGKAAQYIDVMEDLGVVGPPNGPKAREVLMTPDEWHEKLARAQLDD